MLRLPGVVFLVGAAAIASPHAQVKFFNPNQYLSAGLKKLSKPKCALHAGSFLVCSPFDQILYSCTKKVVGSSSNCYFETECVPSGECGSRWVLTAAQSDAPVKQGQGCRSIELADHEEDTARHRRDLFQRLGRLIADATWVQRGAVGSRA